MVRAQKRFIPTAALAAGVFGWATSHANATPQVPAAFNATTFMCADHACGSDLATGTIEKAIFMFQDAGDTSTLSLVGDEGNPIFNNHTDPFGKTVDLGMLAAGALLFQLDNLTTGSSFQTGTASPLDGYFHASYSTNYADFSVLLPAASEAAILALPAGTEVIYVAWEDRTGAQGGDYDYNDLIFAFTSTRADTPPTLRDADVPEPLSLTLLATGLLGLGMVRRRH